MSLKFRNGSKQTSPIAQLIEVATDGSSQASENWSQFMAICDAINSSEDGPKDAVKAIRKRLASKQPPTIMLALKLLETCVKNCGSRFHVYIATKEFMQEMVKIISPKYSPSVELQNTVLGLIQTWAFVFQSNPDLKEVGKMYQELKAKNIEFPALDPDQASQVFIPPKSAPPVAVTEIPLPRAGRSSSNPLSPTGQQSAYRHSQSPPSTAAFSASVPPVDRVTKLRNELSTVQQNCRVFGELLTEVAHGENSNADFELLEDLNATCRQMQKRIVDLIDTIQNEQITEELLTINDELNNVFLRYDRYQRLRGGRSSSSQLESASMPMPPAYEAEPPPRSPVIHAPVQASPSRSLGTTVSGPDPVISSQRVSGGVAVANLIDLDFDTSSAAAASSMEGLSLNSGSGIPAYSHYQVQSDVQRLHQGVSGASDVSGPSVAEAEIAEMEQWLSSNQRHNEEENVTSSEFDQFLQERVRDNERLPVDNSSSRNAAVSSGHHQHHGNELVTL